MVNEKKRNPSVVIIGAGMTGILMTIKLREAGITDITLIEKNGNVGGTWRENTYPGVACDVPAHLYTYQFEHNPDYSNRFAYGAEIQEYFERVARKYGVTEKVLFNEAVVDARYKRGKWTVKTSKAKTMVVDFVVCATGPLHHLVKPQFEGMQEFKGSVFHTAEWDHSIDLKGKRVGIIGTGSTSVQVVSELQSKVSKLSVFQRTPQWVLHTPNRAFTEKEKEKCRKNPFRIPMARLVYSTVFEQLFSKGVTGKKIPHAIMSFLCKSNLKRQVKDTALRRKLTPDYKVGCKRLVMSGTFYKAVQQPNVDLVTDSITRFTENGIVTADGKTHELDAVVLSTGFDPTAFMRPMNLVGKSGTAIDTHWKKKVQAYRAMFLADYPNFFLMLGPNTPIGNFSVIQMSEIQGDYLVKLIDHWRNGDFDEIGVTPELIKNFNQYLKDGMSKTVWVSGCSSWYLDSDGDPLTWPYSWKQWVKEMQAPNMADFETISYGVEQDEPQEEWAKIAV